MYFTFESFMAFLDEDPMDPSIYGRFYDPNVAYEAEAAPTTNPLALRLRAILDGLSKLLFETVPNFFRTLFARHPDARNQSNIRSMERDANKKVNEGKGLLNSIKRKASEVSIPVLAKATGAATGQFVGTVMTKQQKLKQQEKNKRIKDLRSQREILKKEGKDTSYIDNLITAEITNNKYNTINITPEQKDFMQDAQIKTKELGGGLLGILKGVCSLYNDMKAPSNNDNNTNNTQ